MHYCTLVLEDVDGVDLNQYNIQGVDDSEIEVCVAVTIGDSRVSARMQNIIYGGLTYYGRRIVTRVF